MLSQRGSPDITGFVVREHVRDFMVVELKSRAAKFDNIYQTKKYADLFEGPLCAFDFYGVDTRGVEKALKRHSASVGSARRR